MYLVQFTVAWIKATARKRNCVGTSWLRTSRLVHSLVSGLAGQWPRWSVALQIFCGSSVLHSRENSFLRSGKARRARWEKKVRERIQSELWEKETASITPHNLLGSSGLRSLPREPGKRWSGISPENHCHGSMQVKFC